MHAKHDTQLLDSSRGESPGWDADIVLPQVLDDFLDSIHVFREFSIVCFVPLYYFFYYNLASSHARYSSERTVCTGINGVWSVDKGRESTTDKSLGQTFWTIRAVWFQNQCIIQYIKSGIPLTTWRDRLRHRNRRSSDQ